MTETPRPRTLLVISQVYVPDPASVGQHMHDVAVEMARRGWRVIVYTSARGYEDPTAHYPARETVDGVEVRRLPLSSLGKKTIRARVAGGLLFIGQATLRALLAPRGSRMLISTSPPMCAAAAMAVSTLRRFPIVYWVMDMNPDQAVVMGKARAGSAPVRALDTLNRMILRRASEVVALDRFMADRLHRKRDVTDKLSIMPPWPHEDALEVVEHEHNPFRARHGLDGKFVIMYSGNHSPANPLDTLLAAAERLRDRKDIVFMFVGGGLAKREVDAAVAAGAPNIVSLPYQPMSELRYSLSAADCHVVTLGDDVVGMVHPCKVYGAMAVARPVLFFGPHPSHVSDLIDAHQIGAQVSHGDVDGAVRAIEAMCAAAPEARRAMGERAREAVRRSLSKNALCGRFCDVVEGRRAASAAPAAPEAAA
ncbi:MAG: glycosyltransferase family 4 protein [Phycisphaerales bacterium JB039]